jgi:hypothetical protein
LLCLPRLCSALVVATAVAAALSLPLATALVTTTERAALVDLYTATAGATWTSNDGWVDNAAGSDPCVQLWKGVTCRVTCSH